MPSPKVHPINLHTEYPCPYCRRGCLRPITLTEAFGCDRCQQIFVIAENALTIEQLSTSYPYKRSWYWTGKKWQTKGSSGWEELNFVAGNLSFGWRLFLALLGLAVVILIVLMVWLAYRR